MKTRMRELRARYELTQEQLAQLVGVRRETIVHLERPFSPVLLVRLVEQADHPGGIIRDHPVHAHVA